jgi:hypothetical protein
VGPKAKDPPDNEVHPLTRADWWAWQADNHQRGEGVWFFRFKKSSGKSSFDWNKAIEEAIYFDRYPSVKKSLGQSRGQLSGAFWSGF